MRLDGKTAVVTGGTTGIGYETARRFLAEGVSALVITGQDLARLDAAAASLGPKVTAVRADLRSNDGNDRLAERVQQALGGPLDVLFANAGIGFFGPVDTVEADFFDSQFAINVRGLFFSVQKLLPLMASGGSIVLNASAVHGKGLAGGHVYFATKAAVRSFARTLAAELAPRGIRVNTVSPGMIPTPFVGKMGLPQEVLAEFGRQVVAQTPLGRTGTPEEVAAAVTFLASPEASYITAADLPVDGGWSGV
jgi:NAD(P)-dependent dehydrogenase (short-subunit alcohol dehydrogenase family)